MNIKLDSHAAVRLGKWLRVARQTKGFVKRVFAAHIHLTPSKYSEVEAGVSRWIQEPQEHAIVAVLELVDGEIIRFEKMLKQAREAFQLTFSHVFTRSQLEPVRLRSDDHKKPTASDKEIILAAVFTPIL